jgi:hypothetical protein
MFSAGIEGISIEKTLNANTLLALETDCGRIGTEIKGYTVVC